MTRCKVQNSEVYHLWAHQTQTHASGNGACSFEGTRAYSYEACIGKIVNNDAGQRAYLVNTRNYSVTTSKHQSYLHRAIPAGATVFKHESIMLLPREHALQAMVGELPELKSKADRARNNKVWRLSQLNTATTQINEFAAFFGLQHTPITIDGIDAAIAEQKIIHAAYLAEQEERRKAEEAERTTRLMEALPIWLNGEGSQYHSLSYLPTAYLRLVPGNPAETETTRGARVPTSHIRRIMPAVLRNIETGAAVPEVSPRWVLGHYQVNSIEADGTVVAGCHRFAADEVRRFADVLAAVPVENDLTAIPA